MNALSIFLAVLLVNHVTADDQCNQNLNTDCINTLTSVLGLSDSEPWKAPEHFRYEVENLYHQSQIVGTRKVCKAFREFRQCMGDNYKRCIDPLSLIISKNITQLAAYQYVSTFNTIHYTCGAGFQTMIRKHDCFKTLWDSNNSKQLNECRTKFEGNSDGAPDFACTYGNIYMDCWESHIRSICGDQSNDVQFWGCEYARVNIFTRYPTCPNKCVLPSYGGIIG